MSQAISLTCPECGDVFTPTHHRQHFCTPAHKLAHGNRQKGRAQVVALGQAWRAGRNSKDPARKAAAAFAFNRLCRLLDSYTAEDRAAGRADPLDLLMRRQRAGLID